jgi:hypothetical protein
MSIGEYDYEPVRGLPGVLPSGETLLWQGSPAWLSLARRAFRVVPIGSYFLLLALWQAGSVFVARHSSLAALRASGWLLLLGALTVGLLSLIAWLSARATVYSITNRRIVIRHGIALPMSINVPLQQIESVALSTHADGSGDLAVTLTGTERIGYLLTWPHVRPGRYTRPQPALRALPDAAHAGQLLATALGASAAPVREPAVVGRAPAPAMHLPHDSVAA